MRELTEYEKSFLALLCFIHTYKVVSTKRGNGITLFTQEAGYFTKNLPTLNSGNLKSSGLEVNTSENVSILKRRGYVESYKMRFESGYGAVENYYSITEKGIDFIEPFFKEKMSLLSDSEIRYLEKKIVFEFEKINVA